MQPQTPPPAVRQLRRGDDRKIAGVCSGIADYFRVDPTLVRLVFLGGLLLGASSIIVYLAGWLLMPGPALVPLAASSSGTGAGEGPQQHEPARAPGPAPSAPSWTDTPATPTTTLPSTGTDGPQA